jgi:hypothetical protein
VIVAAEHVVDEGNTKIKLDGVFGLELACLEFDYDIACSMWKNSRST